MIRLALNTYPSRTGTLPELPLHPYLPSGWLSASHGRRPSPLSCLFKDGPHSNSRPDSARASSWRQPAGNVSSLAALLCRCPRFPRPPCLPHLALAAARMRPSVAALYRPRRGRHPFGYRLCQAADDLKGAFAGRVVVGTLHSVGPLSLAVFRLPLRQWLTFYLDPCGRRPDGSTSHHGPAAPPIGLSCFAQRQPPRFGPFLDP